MFFRKLPQLLVLVQLQPLQLFPQHQTKTFLLVRNHQVLGKVSHSRSTLQWYSCSLFRNECETLSLVVYHRVNDYRESDIMSPAPLWLWVYPTPAFHNIIIYLFIIIHISSCILETLFRCVILGGKKHFQHQISVCISNNRNK